jgi:hypothetical protein
MSSSYRRGSASKSRKTDVQETARRYQKIRARLPMRTRSRLSNLIGKTNFSTHCAAYGLTRSSDWRVLREAGFIKVEVTGRSGDGGIDGIGVLRVNLLSFQVLFQCKRYQASVGAGAIRDFRGAMVGRSDKGLLITTGTFTPDAKREATRDGAPAIDLIDGDQLCDLLRELKLGVGTEMVEKMTVEPIFFEDL